MMLGPTFWISKASFMRKFEVSFGCDSIETDIALDGLYVWLVFKDRGVLLC